MNRTLTNTHRLGYQPGRARVDGAIWQANATGAPAVSAFDGILTVPTMWTKCSTRHLAPRST